MPVLAWSEVALVALFTIGVAARFYWHRPHPAEESTLERDALRADDRAELTVTDHATLLMDDDGITVNQVNEYTLTRVLGSGSFSQVRLATDGRKMYAFKMIRRKTLERPKLLLRRPAAPDGGAVCSKRQLAEVALMRKLSHPNVVRLFEVIDDAKLPSIFLVLELVRGGTLAEPIKKRRCVADAELRRWLRGVVLGLEHLHFHGVAHRDVKPDNILWCLDTCEPKLTDFGMSSGFDSHRLGGDHVRATGGTMGFFAPEMCTPRARGGFSACAADFWALGVCLYMWIYHQAPYTAPTDALLIEQIASNELELPQSPQRNADLLQLLRGLLQRNPTRRYKPRDLRRDSFLTARGTEPMGPPPQTTELTQMQIGIQKIVNELRVARSFR